tara:strand:+ start:249 stop:728 length:480 start_codon:yes stop_codon:yes gene_type:complete
MAPITSFGKLSFIFALLLALAACGTDRDEPAVRDEEPAPLSGLAPPDEEAFVRTWQGVLPCSDCSGIQTRLTLRRDDEGGQRFELEETYLGAEAGNVFTLEGGWRQMHQRGDSGPAVVFRLDPDGADQWFELQPDGSLELLDARGQPRPDAIGHRLQRI